MRSWADSTECAHSAETIQTEERRHVVAFKRPYVFDLYACVIASMATGLPEEFFTGLPVCEAVKLKNAVNDGDFFE